MEGKITNTSIVRCISLSQLLALKHPQQKGHGEASDRDKGTACRAIQHSKQKQRPCDGHEECMHALHALWGYLRRDEQTDSDIFSVKCPHTALQSYVILKT